MTRSADGDLHIDSVLRNTYKVVSVLGRGGMGAVFLAQHLRLPGKQVAVKVLRTGDHLTPDIYARFRREAEIASRLGHPNIVEVLDFDTLEDGSPFLVLEFLRGESLADRLRRGRMPLEEVLSFVRQMGSALQTAHRAGIVHRDLKPANIFLVPTDSGGVVGERVKLLDFGISKVMSSETLQTQESVLIGTPQYMSPEQAQGRNKQIDARTDEFALGCIVFEMLSGMTPFGGGSLVEIIYRIVHEPPIPLATLVPETPAPVIAAVERALAKNPDDRFPDIGAFVATLTGSPLQSLPMSAAVLEARASSRTSPSGIALPSAVDDADSLSGTIAPGSQGRAQPPNTGRFGEAPAGSGTMGFGATHVPSGTGRFGQPPPQTGGDDLGTGDTLAPGGTARFGQPPPVSDAMGLDATHVPSRPSAAAPAGTLQYGTPPAPVGMGPVSGQGAPAGTLSYGTGAAPQSATGIGSAPVAVTSAVQQAGAQAMGIGSAPVAATSAGQHAGAQVPASLASAPVQPVIAPATTAPQPLPSPSSVSPAPKSRVPMVAAGAVLLIGAVGLGWWLRPGATTPPVVAGNTQQATNTPPQPVAQPTPPTPPGSTSQAVAQPTPPTQAGDTPPSTQSADGPTTTAQNTTSPVPGSPTRPVSNRPARPEAIPDAVRADLDEAESALKNGRPGDAIEIARRSQRKQITAASFSIIARAFCQKGEMGGMTAQRTKVAPSDREAVKRYCKKYDMDF